MANTIFTQKSTCLAVGTFGKSKASKVDRPATHHLRINSKIKYNRCSVPEQNRGLRFQNDTTRKMNMAAYASTQPEAPLPVDPSPSPGHWKVWIIGTIFTILMSFARAKSGPLLQLKEKIDTTIEGAERVADVVEEVAKGVDKVAEEAVSHLPEGKLHDAAEFVEKVAEDIDKHAQNAEDALEKVEDTEKELESFFESTAGPAKGVESSVHQEKSAVTTTESKDQK